MFVRIPTTFGCVANREPITYINIGVIRLRITILHHIRMNINVMPADKRTDNIHDNTFWYLRM